jgi:hypothetical protein
MSDQHNRFENLQSDEERSVEESLMGSDTADFLESEDEAKVRVPGAEGDEDILAKDDQGVTIFNTSSRQLNQEEKKAEEEDEESFDLLALATKEQRRMGVAARNTMRLGELLNPSVSDVDASTITGSHMKAPLTGEVTKAEGLAEQSRLTEDQFKTVDRFQKATAPAPVERDHQEGRKTGGPKSSIPLVKLPQHSAGHSGKGGVQGFKWNDEEEEIPSSKTKTGLSEEERLDEETFKLEREMRELLTKFSQLHEDRNSWYGHEDVELSQRRQELVEDYRLGGIMRLFLLSPKEHDQMRLLPADLMAHGMNSWEMDWSLIKDSRRLPSGREEILSLLREVTFQLESLQKDLRLALGDGAVEELWERHNIISQGLEDPRGISGRTSQLFPRESAGDIVEWYRRLLSGLVEFRRLNVLRCDANDQLSSFTDNYPGPKLDQLHREQQSTTWQTELRRSIGGYSKEATGGSSGVLGQTPSASVYGSRKERRTIEPTKVSDVVQDHGQLGYNFRPGTNPLFGSMGGRPEMMVLDMHEQRTSQPGVNPLFSSATGGPEMMAPGMHEQQKPYPGSNSLFNSRSGRPEMMVPEMLEQQKLSQKFVGSQASRDGDGMGGSMGHSRSEMSQQGLGEYSVHGEEEQVVSLESMDLDGFPNKTRKQIMELIRSYASEKLREVGQLSNLTLKTIVDYFPKMGIYPKDGKEDHFTKSFNRVAKDIKVNPTDSFFSVPQWWRSVNEAGDDYGWSIPIRIRFLTKTGGMPVKVNDLHRDRIMDVMRHWDTWMPNYDPSRAVNDNDYWFRIWIQVAVKMILEFYHVQHQDTINADLEKLMEADKYKFASKDDPLNEDFFRVCLLYQDLNIWLTERSSDFVNSPLYVYGLLKNWLEKQRGVGKVMVDYLEKALAKLTIDPESVFPRYHNLTESQLLEVKLGGRGQATMLTYTLILENLKRRANMKDLTFNFSSLKQLGEMYRESGSENQASGGGSGDWKVRKKDKKTNNTTVSTDLSTLTSMNTTTEQVKYSACADCGLFHDMNKGCLFWDKAKRQFKLKAFLAHRSVRQVNADGSSSLNKFWLKKLEQFGFPRMGITKDSDKEKIISDLKAAVKALPEATVEERRRYADTNKKFMNLAKQEEVGSGPSNHVLESKIDALLANQLSVEKKVKKMSRRKSEKLSAPERDSKPSGGKKKKKKTNRSTSKQKDEESSSSDSAPGLITDSSDDDSELSEGSN